MRQFSGQSETELGRLRMTIYMDNVIFATALRQVTGQLLEGEPSEMMELMRLASATGKIPNQLAEDIVKAGERAMQDLTAMIQATLQTLGVSLITRLMQGDPMKELKSLIAKEVLEIERIQKEFDLKYGGAE